MRRSVSKLVAMIRLVHAFPVTVVVTTSTVLILIASHGSPGGGVLARAVTVVLLSQISVGALNEYVDRNVDAIAQPQKPIPSGLVSPAAALTISVIGAIALIPLALTFGLAALSLAVLGTAAGLAYDLWLKPTALSVVAYIVGFMALVSWVWLVSGRFAPWFLLAYPGVALLLTAAHLAQSFPDIETDRQTGQHGLAALLGVRRTFRAIVGLYIAMALAGFVLALVAQSLAALALVALSLAILTAACGLQARTGLTLDARRRLFHLLAPGIGLLGLGCFVSITSLGT